MEEGAGEFSRPSFDVLASALFAICVSCQRSAGSSGGAEKMLASPLFTTPGCMPKNGTSKLTVPTILCFNGLSLVGEGIRATSAITRPPILCPSNTTSVFSPSCGVSHALKSSRAQVIFRRER